MRFERNFNLVDVLRTICNILADHNWFFDGTLENTRLIYNFRRSCLFLFQHIFEHWSNLKCLHCTANISSQLFRICIRDLQHDRFSAKNCDMSHIIAYATCHISYNYSTLYTRDVAYRGFTNIDLGRGMSHIVAYYIFVKHEFPRELMGSFFRWHLSTKLGRVFRVSHELF